MRIDIVKYEDGFFIVVKIIKKWQKEQIRRLSRPLITAADCISNLPQADTSLNLPHTHGIILTFPRWVQI